MTKELNKEDLNLSQAQKILSNAINFLMRKEMNKLMMSRIVEKVIEGLVE